MHLLLLTIEEHCSLHTKQAVSYNEGKMLMQMVARVGKAGGRFGEGQGDLQSPAHRCVE